MELFQKLGEKAKGIGEKARDIGGKARGVGEKAMEITRRSADLLEVTKMKYELSKLEKEMENNLSGLGMLVFQKYQGVGDLDEEIERLCQSTARLEEEMKKMEAEIEKHQPKAAQCPDCNVELPAGGKFCSFCGAEVIKGEE